MAATVSLPHSIQQLSCAQHDLHQTFVVILPSPSNGTCHDHSLLAVRVSRHWFLSRSFFGCHRRVVFGDALRREQDYVVIDGQLGLQTDVQQWYQQGRAQKKSWQPRQACLRFSCLSTLLANPSLVRLASTAVKGGPPNYPNLYSWFNSHPTFNNGGEVPYLHSGSQWPVHPLKN